MITLTSFLLLSELILLNHALANHVGE